MSGPSDRRAELSASPIVVPTLADLRRLLAAHRPDDVVGSRYLRKAAVAALFRERAPGASPELLLIRRAESPTDRWSGQMAFPGGKVETGDPDPLSAAIRETREEIGLDLNIAARPLGRLSSVAAVARGGAIPMAIVPFAFELAAGADPVFRTNHEVAGVVWVSLSYLLDRANRSTHEWTVAGLAISLPCYRFDGNILWGLTLGMIDELLDLVSPPR